MQSFNAVIFGPNQGDVFNRNKIKFRINAQKQNDFSQLINRIS